MKRISQRRALEKLKDLRAAFRDQIAPHQQKAKSCSACDTSGACCLDVHFVNVHISRLEAVAAREVIDGLPNSGEVYLRINETVDRFGLSSQGDTYRMKFACPLYESGTGCLVHRDAKPLACIAHACYESAADIPPPELLSAKELEVDRLNDLAYGKPHRWLPLPLAIKVQG
jgi:hypothetical protein